MSRRFHVILALMLISVFAFGGNRKDNGRVKVAPYTPFVEQPLSAAERAMKFAPHISTARGATLSVGTYTMLEGYYDYQSNGGTNQYIRVDPTDPNKIHVIYMIAEDGVNVNPSRRTAYAYSSDGGATWSDFADVRVPSGIRSGFPSLDLMQGVIVPGQPIVMNHLDPGPGLRSGAHLGGPGDGLFTTFNPLPDLFPSLGGEPIWAFVAGASDGSVAFQASVSNTTTAPPEKENYINRTTDGLTWEEPWITLIGDERAGGRNPTFSNTTGRVATIVPVNLTGGDSVWLVESTNNGATWGTPVVLYDGFRVTPGGLSSAYICVDGVYSGSDAFVAQQSLTWDPIDTAATNSDAKIEFWSNATGWVDAVNDPLLFSGGSGGTNHFGSVGYPGIGLSGSTVVIVFQGFLGGSGTLDPVSGFRHSEIFLTRSTDAGATWSLPVNMTNTPQVDERYPSISKYNQSGFANIVWQEDITAGASSFTDLTDTTLARQVFYKADLTTIFPANDITALSVDEPTGGNGIAVGSSFAAKASFRNIGLAPQTSVDVKFEVLNSSNSVVYTNTKQIASLASGATQQVTFDPVPGSLSVGLYTTRATSLLAGDLVQSNDTTTNTVNIIPIITVPSTGYATDFESPAPEGGSTGWYAALTSGSGSPEWVLGTPAKLQIAGAHSGTKAWVTKLTGTHGNNQETFVGSPVFDMTALSTNVLVEFWQNFQIEPNWDGGVFQYSTDGGTLWVTADHVLGTGSTFNTATSTGWYNEDTDSSAGPGFPAPPMWSHGSTDYAGHSSGWIRSSTVIPVGGQVDVRLRWRWSTDASAVFEGWAIDDVSFGAASASINVGIDAGWNMVSNPVTTSADSVRELYPNSQFAYGFRFDGAAGYQQSSIMANSVGYWAKFPAAEVNNIAGDNRFSSGVSVAAGWNMVGSISVSVDTATITSSPAGIRASGWFGFSGGYTASPTIEPGKAYWVKSSAPGSFYFADAAPAARPAAKPQATVLLEDIFNTITLTDANGASQTLYFGVDADDAIAASFYELPPAPPSGAFDVRFMAENIGTMLAKHEGRQDGVQLPIAMQSVALPFEISWNVKEGIDRQYVLSDGLGGSVVATRTLTGKSSIKVDAAGVSRLYIGVTGGEALPTSYALLQNYPNPFNPSTNINFALPAPSKVNVEIYNLLGQRVRMLVNESMPAGFHSVEWNGTGASGQLMGSGVYFVRFSADGGNGNSFNDVRKLMLMK
ncbi:MAG: FlgD immunoglobulin-like domain containing protein [Bacteroidota bacterium]